ncbi:MAG: diaminobutyrate acetyltransferase [Actinomycetes bacterium]
MHGDTGTDSTAAPPEAVGSASGLRLDAPRVEDGADLWRIARDSASLDLNSSYSYLLWCRDFAATSVIARVDGHASGYVTGYRRPRATDTLVVWQVAVDVAQRGKGLARRMIDHLVDRVVPEGVRYLEATVTPDNVASTRLFTAFAEGRGAGLHQGVLFEAGHFPDGHEAEVLLRIGPFAQGVASP